MRYILSCFLILLFAVTRLYAQDPQFSQFYANPLYTNPAFVGAANNFRVVLAARDQYTALQNNFRTYSASADVNSSALGGGIGLLAMQDVSGDGFLTSTTFSGLYSYQLNVSRKLTMRAGIQATYMQRSYDFSRFRFGDQIDDRYGFIYATSEKAGSQVIALPNFSFGMLAYTRTFFGGFAIHNLTEPNQSFYFPSANGDEFKLPRRYTGHAGVNIFLTNQRDEDERVILSPNVLFMTQRNYNQLNLGFYLKKQALTTGLWFRQTSRNSDAVIVLVGLKYPRFRVGYSYDITVSGARTVTQGSHELTLSFEIPKKKRERKSFKPLTCPDF